MALERGLAGLRGRYELGPVDLWIYDVVTICLLISVRGHHL